MPSKRTTRIRTAERCPHEEVRITRIVQGRSGDKATRTIGGRCDKCSADVTRTQTLWEFETGVPENWWR